MYPREKSQETGNDSRRKRQFQREERYHQASIKERTGVEQRGDGIQWNSRKKKECFTKKVCRENTAA